MTHRIIILGSAPDPELLKLLQERFQPREEVIDETEAVPVLTDEPEDPEVAIETLQARILHLEAELEEHRRSVDGVLEALRGLGSTDEVPVASETLENATEPPALVEPMPAQGYEYLKAQAGARRFLSLEPIPGSSWPFTNSGWVRK